MPRPYPWITGALLELGVSERTHAERIERTYHGATRAGRAPASVPWCSSFLCHVFGAVGLEHPRSKRARSWLTWGEPAGLELGAVVVYRRGANPLHGHVHVLLYADGAWIWGVGGNQSNAVSVARYPREDVIGLRWPLGVARRLGENSVPPVLPFPKS